MILILKKKYMILVCCISSVSTHLYIKIYPLKIIDLFTQLLICRATNSRAKFQRELKWLALLNLSHNSLNDICSELLLWFQQYFQTFLNMYFQRILKHLNIWTGSFEARQCTKMSKLRESSSPFQSLPGLLPSLRRTTASPFQRCDSSSRVI